MASRTTKSTVGIAAVFIALVHYSPSIFGQILTGDAWREDLSALRAAILETHPRPFTKISKQEWTNRYNALSSRIDSLSDHDVVIAMAELVALLQDGHTRLTLPTRHPDIGVSFAHSATPDPTHEALRLGRLPIVLRDFDDGIFVIKATDQHKHVVGQRVVAIGQKDIATVVETVAPAIHAENEQFSKVFLPDRLTIPEVLSYYGVAEDTTAVAFELEGSNGDRATEEIESVADAPLVWHSVESRLEQLPRWLRQPERDYWYELIGNALYIQYNEIGYDGNHPLLPFVSEMLAAADRRGADRVIIDLRHNFGGDATWMLPFFRAVTRHEKFDRPGGLYVLIGRRTFSAAALLVNELEQHTHALFVGEATGARPDTFGDSRKTQLPNSGLTVRISTIFWKNWLAGEYRQAISPHIATPLTFEDYSNGHDPALDAALSHRLPGSPVDYFATLLTETDVNTAALFISKYLLDPRYGAQDFEKPLLALGYRFLKAQDPTNARFTFLLAETYYSRSPDVLAALGLALEELGRKEEAVDTYRRALNRDANHKGAAAGLTRLSN